MDLTLNNLQWLICHKIKPNPNPSQSSHSRCSKSLPYSILSVLFISKVIFLRDQLITSVVNTLTSLGISILINISPIGSGGVL